MSTPGSLWLQFPPQSESAPKRLIIFLHGAGARAESMAPVALTWQMRFPGATLIVPNGTVHRPDGRHDWFQASSLEGDAPEERARRLLEAIPATEALVRSAQTSTGIGASDTALVGFSQGATMAIELVRSHPGLASIVVSYAGRLVRPLGADEQLGAAIHLIHGEFDSIVPPVHSQRAFDALKAAGAHVTFDLALDFAHTIGLEMVNMGTQRMMQTLFRHRSRRPDALH